MKEFKYYKQLIGAIILAGIMIMMALRISDIASGLDAIFTAFVPHCGRLYCFRIGYSSRSL